MDQIDQLQAAFDAAHPNDGLATQHWLTYSFTPSWAHAATLLASPFRAMDAAGSLLRFYTTGKMQDDACQQWFVGAFYTQTDVINAAQFDEFMRLFTPETDLSDAICALEAIHGAIELGYATPARYDRHIRDAVNLVLRTSEITDWATYCAVIVRIIASDGDGQAAFDALVPNWRARLEAFLGHPLAPPQQISWGNLQAWLPRLN